MAGVQCNDFTIVHVGCVAAGRARRGWVVAVAVVPEGGGAEAGSAGNVFPAALC